MFKIPNNSNLTDEELRAIMRVDTTGQICKDDAATLPGVHFCPDWDGLAIFNKTPEWDCCTCKIKQEISNGLL